MPQTSTAPTPTLPVLYRLTATQYHQMLEAGVFQDGDPIELIEGMLVQKMTQGRRHVLAIDRMTRLLPSLLPGGWHAEFQPSIIAGALSVPEPDGAVIRGAAEDYRDHPQASDIGIGIEVSDSTLSWDRKEKKALYSAARIPVYWIINLIHGQIEVYSDPTGPEDEPDYRRREDYLPGDEIPLVLDGVEVATIAVSELLPP